MLSTDVGIIKMHLDVMIKDITIKGQGAAVKIGFSVVQYELQRQKTEGDFIDEDVVTMYCLCAIP